MKIIDGGRTERQTRRTDGMKTSAKCVENCAAMRSIKHSPLMTQPDRYIPLSITFTRRRLPRSKIKFKFPPSHAACSNVAWGRGEGVPQRVMASAKRVRVREGDSHKTLGTSVNLSTNIWTARAGTGDWRRRRRLDKLRDTRRGTTRQSSRGDEGRGGRCSDANWANWRIVASFSIIKCCQLCANGR